MKLIQGVAAVALLAAGTAAHAEVTGTITGVTDYDWRGVTQSAQGPALQGSLDYAHDSGFYAGVWASNVDFGAGDPNVEIDLYAGFGGGETFVWDVGAVYYTYPGESSFNFPELYASLGWEWLEGKISYTYDFGGSDDTAFYYEANVTYPLPANFGFTGHIGYSDGDGIESVYGVDNYMDWSVGLTYEISHFTLALKWVDGEDNDCCLNTKDDISSTEARAIFSISTTFPWSSDEAEGVEMESKAAEQ
jgi:uncharacterized protein (TIGR02001 family)